MRKRKYFIDRGLEKGIFIVPNSITVACMFCGFYSIVASTSGDFSTAVIFILVAMVLDTLDGRIARLTKTISKFGSEFDSLADVISFGVAPAILAYSWALSPYGRFGWLLAFFFVACGAIRLARFNVQIGQFDSKYFNGLPIPAAAAVVATAVQLSMYLELAGAFRDTFFFIMFFYLALLMVSSIKYYSFKDLNYFTKKPLMSLILFVGIVIVVVAEPRIMLFTLIFGYSLTGPVWWLTRTLSRRQRHLQEQEEPVTESQQKPS